MPVHAKIAIENKKGLHARAAAKFVKIAGQYPETNIKVLRLIRQNGATENVQVMANSVLGLLMLAAEKGVSLEMEADGTQAEEAMNAIIDIAKRKFDEGE